MTSDKCSCGARDKNKCSKESGLGGGKMCLKDDNKAFDELTEKLWKENPEEMAEAQPWAKNFIEKWKEDPGLVIVGDWFIDDTIGVDWKTFIGDKDDHRNDH
jgi:hypothetical protein